MIKILLSLFVFMNLVSVSNAEEKISQDKIKDLKVTIYNENLALVKDKREVDLKKGLNEIAYLGVSAFIRPETAILTGGKINILEQNFNYDLLSPQSMIDKAVGEEVKLVDTLDDGKQIVKDAKVLSVNGGLVLEVDGKIEINPRGRLVFSKIPENLREKPTLVLSFLTEDNKKSDLELSYLTGGLSWKADYIAKLDEKDEKIDISGLVTLNNNSGTSYEKASLQLVAGDVNQVRQVMQERFMAKAMRADMELNSDMAGGMAEESFADYHLYSLPRKVDILEKQVKQVSMLSSNDVNVEKEYLYQNPFRLYRNSNSEFKKLNPSSYLKFKNEEDNNLGMALPKGVVRVYKTDSKGNMLFVGEDSINHTPKKEEVRLKLGNAFDVTAEGKIVESSYYQRRYDATFEMVVKNAKNSPVKVKLEQNFPNNYVIERENITSTKESATKSSWVIEVPAEGEAKLTVKFFAREV
ncbi:MAG: hypothetical protein BWY78_00816 [Alphaproteobacteria bacterium ADurb.Bin438]|nr:MAG: hypothetical protein BWY78_00816 [Alphaproteobacteria bacterium ADurb.Bin438]